MIDVKPLDLKPEDLHKWYLEATKKLKPRSYNKSAQKPYDELTDEQRFIDKFICEKTKQRVRSACMFYLRYKDKPMLLVEEYPDMLGISPRIKKLTHDLNELLTKYRVNTHFIGRKIVESLGMEEDIKKLRKDVEKLGGKLFELIKQEIKINFLNNKDYNDWLFRLCFKDVFKGKDE